MYWSLVQDRGSCVAAWPSWLIVKEYPRHRAGAYLKHAELSVEFGTQTCACWALLMGNMQLLRNAIGLQGDHSMGSPRGTL